MNDEAVRELPEKYGEDTLVAMPRDPWWAFAYWEVSEKTVKQAQEKLGAQLHGSQIVLRVVEAPVRDTSGNVPELAKAGTPFDIPVGTLMGSWYLQLEPPGRSFCLELGYSTPNGKFISLVQSNLLRLPGKSGSEDPDSEWMGVDEESASESFLQLSS